MVWKRGGQQGFEDLGQYSTPTWLGSLLLSQVNKAPKLTYDLGLGLGALSRAALEQFPRSEVIGVDIEPPSQHDRAELNSRGIRAVLADLTRPNSWGALERRFGQADLVVSNPPFLNVPSTAALHHALRRLRTPEETSSQLRSELIFLAAGIRLLKPAGEAAFILPYSILECHSTAKWLGWMVDRGRLGRIIELSEPVFSGTEVRTALFLFGDCTRYKAPRVYRLGSGRQILRDKDAEEKLEGRLNGIQFVTRSRSKIKCPTLASLGVAVRRGTQSKVDFERQHVPYFHTTSFASFGSNLLKLGQNQTNPSTSHITAEEGDILLPRVGSRCLGYEARVISGRRVITDCVLRLRGPEAAQQRIWNFLRSERGREWRMALAKGTCAQFIPQGDLVNTPIPLQDIS